jgi:NADH-quinone oxidoreductase subunit J
VIWVFYGAGAVTLVATALAITRANAVHGLLWFVLSLLGMAVVFFALGAAFAAALEVIVYAGAIVVLFLFVVMMLRIDAAAVARETGWMTRPVWVVPILLAAVLGAVLAGRIFFSPGPVAAGVAVSPQAVGLRLFTADLAAVELASMLLLAALVGAFHLGRRA